jgi:hypothetical protein
MGISPPDGTIFKLNVQHQFLEGKDLQNANGGMGFAFPPYSPDMKEI